MKTELENSAGGKVGYCRPPEHTRFGQGQSGNPNGRPKSTLNLATVLERKLREKKLEIMRTRLEELPPELKAINSRELD
jgi:Family of unknown function (DUF5681)